MKSFKSHLCLYYQLRSGFAESLLGKRRSVYMLLIITGWLGHPSSTEANPYSGMVSFGDSLT